MYEVQPVSIQRESLSCEENIKKYTREVGREEKRREGREGKEKEKEKREKGDRVG